MTPTRTEGDPHDRLTRICDAMTRAMEAHPEYQGDKCCIFMDSDVEKRGGLVLFGYEEDADAITSLFIHLRAIFKANGKELMFAPLGGDG